MLPDRAYSTFQIKSVDSEQRIIEGFASTPALDRGGDVMAPEGAQYTLPMPFLWHHQQDKPLGHVLAARVTSSGIHIRARIEKGVLPFIDEAWSLIKSGLVRGLSIGWRPLVRPEASGGGLRYAKWEWFETSAVTVPMNVQTTIALVKSLDAAYLAAPGTGSRSPAHPPGASGLRKRAAMTISEQVTAAKTDLQAKSARLEELITKDKDEGGLDQTEVTERDAIKISVKSLVSQIDDLSTLESAQRLQASPIVIARPQAQQQQNQIPKVEVKALPKGTGFTRYAMAVAAGKGSYSDTLAYAKRWEGQTPEVVQYVKAIHGKAIEGTSVMNSPAWGSELVFQNNLASEFVELLRPRTIMGRIPGLRMSPFNVRIPVQTDGSTVDWVGESAVKPVSDLGFSTVTLGYHKIAGIVVLTEELVRLSSPNAEETVRRDLVEQIARFMDRQFIDPTVTATANRPASITNGVASPAAGGTTAEDLYFDLNAALATFDAADQSTESVVIIMTPALARGISTLRNALGQFEFTGLTMNGGTLMGFPVVVSSSVPAGTIVIVAAGEILVADDGRVDLDASNEATLDMAGGGTPNFSLWQRNCIGIRAERFVTWIKRREDSVAVIDTASYGPTAPA
jgi:HK97 family phage major capsid protein